MIQRLNYTVSPKANSQERSHLKTVESQAVDDSHSLKLLKKGIYAYLILLVFEGALRKWVLPELSAPLLVVRDPVAIWLIYLAWKRNLIPYSNYLASMLLVAILGVVSTLVFGHGNLSVTLFGARILLLHFPLMFVIAGVMDREDVIKMGKLILLMSLPIVILTALQFYSPQSAWVNRGVGGDVEGSGFSGAMGFFRPSGTFSFTTGNSLFFSLVACFVLYFWISKTKVNRLLLILATLGVLASIPLSISRGLFFSIMVTLVFTVIAISRKPEYFPKLLLAVVSVMLLLAILSQTSFFNTATAAFTARFENASSVEGGVASSLVERYFGGMISAVSDTNALPFFGYGMGMGTNAGSAILTGDRAFLIAEGEWGRLIGEMGVLLGLAVIFIRMVFCLYISIASYKKLKYEDFLPWILLSYALLVIPQGQWAQPTSLGFSTLIGGLLLASLNFNKKASKIS